MGHQPLDVLPGLGFDLGGQQMLRVRGAGEREVLPDEHPELVAHVVEGVVLVDAPAPHAHQVDVGVDRLAGAAGGSARGVTRDGNGSSGIQLTPRTNIGGR